MAARFHPLPLDAYPDEARPALARMNAELRDLFALEGTIRTPLKIQRSDSTVVRKSTDQVHVTRITPDISSMVAGVSSVIGVLNLTFSTVDTVGTTNTVLSVDSTIAMFDVTAPAGYTTRGKFIPTGNLSARPREWVLFFSCRLAGKVEAIRFCVARSIPTRPARAMIS